MEGFSGKILRLRTQQRMSQEDVAEKLGVSRQSVQKWESGQSEPGLKSVAALSRIFGVTCDFLLQEDAKQELIIENSIGDEAYGRISAVGECTSEKLRELRKHLLDYAMLDEGLPIDLDLSGMTGLTILPERTFKGCKTLRSIRLPEGLQLIGSDAFCDCTSLRDVYLPSTMKRIATKAFHDTRRDSLYDGYDDDRMLPGEEYFEEYRDSLRNVTFHFNGTTEQWLALHFPNTHSDIVIGSLYIQGKPVTEIAIPSGLEKILLVSGWYWTNVTALRIPSSVKEITTDAIYHHYPESLLPLKKLFYEGTVEEFMGVYFPFKVDELYIGGKLFTEYTIPEGTEVADCSAFHKYPYPSCMSSVKTLNVPVSVKKFSPHTLKDSIIENIRYAGTLEQWLSIEGNEFEGKLYINGKLLTELKIPDGVRGICINKKLLPYSENDGTQFSSFGSFNYERVIIPSSVEVIGWLPEVKRIFFENQKEWHIVTYRRKPSVYEYVHRGRDGKPVYYAEGFFYRGDFDFSRLKDMDIAVEGSIITEDIDVSDEEKNVEIFRGVRGLRYRYW